jgi:hypothetical protein
VANFSPSKVSKIYALPDTHWLIRYGPSHVGDHIPYFGSPELIGNICFETRSLLTVKFGQPSHEFTFGVGMNFISYPLVHPLGITSSFVHVSFGV